MERGCTCTHTCPCRTIIPAWGDARASCIVVEYVLRDRCVHYTTYGYTAREIPLEPDLTVRPSFPLCRQKLAPSPSRGRYRTSAYCAGIILCKSHYSHLTALQPTVMYSGGGFMRLCGIIPDLTHYCAELGATIRASVRERERGRRVGGESRDRLFLVVAQSAVLRNSPRAKRALVNVAPARADGRFTDTLGRLGLYRTL